MRKLKREPIIDGDAVKIPLQRGVEYLTFVDIEDFNKVKNFTWRAMFINGILNHIKARNGCKHITLHHLIMGRPPPGMVVDHIDGDPANNRRSNLRFVTLAQNQHNRRRTCGSSKYKGVSWHKRDKKYQVQIYDNSKKIYLGSFDSEEDAARVYDKKALELFGEYACTNEMLGKFNPST